MTVHEAVCLAAEATAALSDEIEASNHALAHYFRGEWSEARQVFRILHDAVPQHAFYDLLLRRIDALESRGIGPGWDGVFEHTAK